MLDQAFPVPYTRYRFGLDALIGLVPGLGDAAGGLLACYALLAAIRLGVPVSVFARMIGNILVDVFVGEVPVLGDLLDITWQANVRNLALLEAWRADPARVRSASRAGLIVLSVLILLFVFAAAALALYVAWSILTGLTQILAA